MFPGGFILRIMFHCFCDTLESLYGKINTSLAMLCSYSSNFVFTILRYFKENKKERINSKIFHGSEN